MNDPNAPPCSDAAVKAKTGRSWQEWCALLDSENAVTLAHRDIVSIVAKLHSGGGWWSQAVTVGYERLRGKRQLFGRSDGTYTANASKTLPNARDRIYDLLVSGHKRRRWAPAGLKVIRNTSSRVVRFIGRDGSRIEVFLQPKDDGRTIVAVQVSKLSRAEDVETTKAVWKRALENLNTLVSAA